MIAKSAFFRQIIVWKEIEFNQFWVNKMQILTSINFITLIINSFTLLNVPKP